ncbi:MAG: CinA family protein [Alphaproteobacteria bacterium]
MNSIFPLQLQHAAQELLDACRRKKLHLVTAESCTGGLIAALLTDRPGSSAVFAHGFVTYANAAKREMIGVRKKTLEKFGAVSPEVAIEMAEGARREADADLAVSVTGIAGPDGGSRKKPVGTVHIAVARKKRKTLHEGHHFTGDRTAVRLASVEAALRLVMKRIA